MRSYPPRFKGKAGLQQRVLPSYRIPFIDKLGESCGQGLEVFAGRPRPHEAILHGRQPQVAVWVNARNLEIPGPSTLVLQPGLTRWIRGWRPQALVLEANPRYLANWFAPGIARAHRARVVGWGLGAPRALEPGAPLRRGLWGTFLSRFDALIAYSNRGAGEYERCGFDPQEIYVAHNAVLDGPSLPIAREPAAGRPLRVLFVGRLQQRKLVDLLLRACAEVDPEAEVRIVGDGPARSELEVVGRRMLQRVDFTGALEGEALSEAFGWADLFVLPGTGGLAVQEAMAHGLPVIAAAGDGTQEDLVRPSNGWLVEPGSYTSLLGALRRAQADPGGLLKMGESSRRIVAEEVNLGRMVEVFIEAMAGSREREEP